MTVPKPCRWLPPARDEIQALPEDVQDALGFRLRRLQDGKQDSDKKHIKRFGEDRRIAHLMKIVDDGADGNTYRLVVTVEFEEGFWAIDAFEKKSSSGISTPKRDIDRIVERLSRLNEYRATFEGQEIIASMRAETQAYEDRLRNAPVPPTRRLRG